MSSHVFELIVNGEPRHLPELSAPAMLDAVIHALALTGDRVAVECNGEIAPRRQWSSLPVHSGDKLEIVHFVGGGNLPRP